MAFAIFINLLVQGSDGFLTIIVAICLRYFMTSSFFALVDSVRSKRAFMTLFFSILCTCETFDEIPSIIWFWSKLFKFWRELEDKVEALVVEVEEGWFWELVFDWVILCSVIFILWLFDSEGSFAFLLSI